MSFHALERLLQAAKAKGYVDTIALIGMGVTSTLLVQTGYRQFYPSPPEANVEQAAQIKDLSARIDKLTSDQEKVRASDRVVRTAEASDLSGSWMDRSPQANATSAGSSVTQSSALEDFQADYPSTASSAAANAAKERHLAAARANSQQRARSQSSSARRSEPSGVW